MPEPLNPLVAPAPDQPTPDQPMSAESLSAAFARLLAGDASGSVEASTSLSAVAANLGSVGAADVPPLDDQCEISPSSLLEAMLFVGDPDNKPLSGQRLAGLLRGVEATEINDLVHQLNERYAARRAPYRIVGEAEGYRMTLANEFQRVRQRFFGRVRQARLSQAAIDVLSLVAYREPLAADELAELRGKPCAAILAQLVRRQLLSVVRDDENPRRLRYRTTRRFLDLFGLASLDDLPRNQDLTGS